MEYSIQINDKRYGLISRFSVPKWLAAEYCTMSFTLYFGKESIHIDSTDKCFLCGRLFAEATRKCPLLCTNMDINHKLGYVGRNCIDCSYYLKELDGYDATPKSIKTFLEAGFVPANIHNFLV